MIDHQSSIPLYQQIADTLKGNIHSGVYVEGDKLPSEKQLSEQYDVSRITVRQAMNALLAEELVFSVQGKGTFVKTVKIQQKIRKITRFSRILSEKGVSGRTRIYSFDEACDDEKALSLFPAGCVSICLLGYARSSPVAYYSSFVVAEYGRAMRGQAEELEKRGQAFTTLDLWDLAGASIARVEQSVSACGRTAVTDEVFGRFAPPAYLVLETYYYSGDDRLLEHKKAYYRCDVYSFQLDREI